MRVQVEELKGAALYWAVAKCKGIVVNICADRSIVRYVDGKPIECIPTAEDIEALITDERISVVYEPSLVYGADQRWKAMYLTNDDECVRGPTPRVAILRCYVVKHLGVRIELPGTLSVGY